MAIYLDKHCKAASKQNTESLANSEVTWLAHAERYATSFFRDA